MIYGISNLVENKRAKRQKYLVMLWGTLRALILGNVLVCSGVMRPVKRINLIQNRILTARNQYQSYELKFLIPLDRASNFEITKYFNYEFKPNGVYSKDY